MFLFYPERTRLMFTCVLGRYVAPRSLISTDNFRRARTASADSCTETKECPLSGVTTVRVPGEIKRREVELDSQVSPEEFLSREVELGCESWTSFASGCSSTAVQRTLSL